MDKNGIFYPLHKQFWTKQLLIIKSEVPERDDVAVGIFNVIFHDYTTNYSFYLLPSFLAASYLKGVFTNHKIRFLRGDDIVADLSLIIEKGLPDITDETPLEFSAASPSYIH